RIKPYLLIYRRKERKWKQLDVQGNVRAFGRFVAIAEYRTKKERLRQEEEHRGNVDINQAMREEEQSPGRAEGSTEVREYGPPVDEAFESSVNVYTGRLLLYDSASEKMRTIVTKQANSEILLVENDRVYYRISGAIWEADITADGFGTPELIAIGD